MIWPFLLEPIRRIKDEEQQKARRIHPDPFMFSENPFFLKCQNGA
jgi:hypothetical protein